MTSTIGKIDELIQTLGTDNKSPSQPQSITNSHHHSWNNTHLATSVIDELRKLKSSTTKIPIFDVTAIDITTKQTQTEIYNKFYNETGAIIVRGAYTQQTMQEYNKWCEDFLEIAKNDGNCRHPKQPGKYLINDIMLRLAKDNADLLLKLINNPYFTTFCDVLLGFMKFGSCTAHWIEPGGDRQLSHVDYPMHVGSGPFWEHNVNKLMQLTTANQINNILPFYSIQVLIASDAMSVRNGSTEMIPCSHRIPNVDVLVHDEKVYKELEPYFINVDLQQGDFLIFNRRLVHRGGKNISNKRRNSLIMQCVWLWGVGQEIMEHDKVMKYLEKSEEFMKLSDEEKERFLIRLRPPYPANIKKST